MKIIVGTRGSNLAVTQTNHVIDMLREKNPDVEFEVKTIKTKGDILKDIPLDKIGGKEVFIKEIEKELLEGDIDLAIHSMKDVPGILPEGLKLSYIPKREDHRDVLVLKKGINSIDELKKGAKIGTGSKRRKYQMLELREDLEIVGIRGNVQTRIEKIESENLDGVILAAAGINRLSLELENTVIHLDNDQLLSSPCQGILALEIRDNDLDVEKVLKTISHDISEIQSQAERAFLKGTGGSCHVPVGAYLEVKGDDVTLYGMLGTEGGEIIRRASLTGDKSEAEELGIKLANILNEEIGK